MIKIRMLMYLMLNKDPKMVVSFKEDFMLKKWILLIFLKCFFQIISEYIIGRDRDKDILDNNKTNNLNNNNL